MSRPQRVDGFAPIESYAAIGDGRTVALVALDGSIDWLPLHSLDDVTMFGALLDADKGGAFTLAPVDDYEVTRRYVPCTNLLETTFTTESGVAVVTDVLSLQDGGQLSWVELVRRIQGKRGNVKLRYEVRPRCDYGRAKMSIERRGDTILACGGGHIISFRAWDAGEPEIVETSIAGELETSRKSDGVLICTSVDSQPIPLPPRDEVEIRVSRTADAWKRWVDFHDYEGDWEDAVERSALALKLLIQAHTGAIAAAPTTSLPEKIGGDQNWDYRFAWIRDTAFVLDALGELGYREQVHASLAWLLRASENIHPRLQPFLCLDGSVPTRAEYIDMTGYRGSRPVKNGNAASGQLQLGTYGDLLATIELYVRHGNLLDEETGIRLAEVADHVCRIWQREDSGIWELHDTRQYTSSKIACWVALDRAITLAGKGEAPSEHVDRWREECGRIRAWIDEHCWSDGLGSYSFYAGSDELDASLLLAVRVGYLPPDDPRLASTVDAIRAGLAAGGPLLYRYTGASEKEGAFVACSFWLVESYARMGRVDDARELMDALVARSNDVGLYAEEIDPETGAFLGNFPQALTHLSLINAATAIQSAEKEKR